MYTKLVKGPCRPEAGRHSCSGWLFSLWLCSVGVLRDTYLLCFCVDSTLSGLIWIPGAPSGPTHGVGLRMVGGQPTSYGKWCPGVDSTTAIDLALLTLASWDAFGQVKGACKIDFDFPRKIPAFEEGHISWNQTEGVGRVVGILRVNLMSAQCMALSQGRPMTVEWLGAQTWASALVLSLLVTWVSHFTSLCLSFLIYKVGWWCIPGRVLRMEWSGLAWGITGTCFINGALYLCCYFQNIYYSECVSLFGPKYPAQILKTFFYILNQWDKNAASWTKKDPQRQILTNCLRDKVGVSQGRLSSSASALALRGGAFKMKQATDGNLSGFRCNQV